LSISLIASAHDCSPRWLPPLMLHAVLSPLILVLAHHRARVEHKRNEVLRGQERQLHEVRRLEALGRLAGGVAHDFNNLLTVILSNVQLLATDGNHDVEVLKDVFAAAERASALVQQLLRFARGQPAERGRADVNRVIGELRPILEHLKGSRVQLELETAPELPKIAIDRSQLEQVILNLVINARDAMPSGGTLRIRTACSEASDAGSKTSFVALLVSDTGIGMSEATRQSIFEPFFTTRASQGGTGLGLSIVQSIVVKSGGHVRVQSQLGHGSTFEILLPCLDAILPDPSEQARAARGAAVES
jgi:two-component system cell cycle sensor histidine kinase/response regulator CckA